MQEHEASVEEMNTRGYSSPVGKSRKIRSSTQTELNDSHCDTEGDP